MEDLGFISYVKNLFAQLLWLLENNVPDMTNNCFNQKVQVLGHNGAFVGHSMNFASEWNKLMKDNQERDMCYDPFSVVNESCNSVDATTSNTMPRNCLDCSLTKQLSSCTLVPFTSTSAKNLRIVHNSKPEACEDLKAEEMIHNPENRLIHNPFHEDIQSNSVTFLEEQLSSMSCSVSEISGKEELILYDMKNERIESRHPNLDFFDSLYNSSISHGFQDDTVLHYIDMNDNESGESTSACMYKQHVSPIADGIVGASGSTAMFAEAKVEQDDLLDAVVSYSSLGSSQHVNNNVNYRNSEAAVASYSSSSGKNSLLPYLKDLHGGFINAPSQHPKEDHQGLSTLSHGHDKTEWCYESKIGQRCEISTFTEDGLDVRGVVTTSQLKSAHEVGKLPRKRSRLGENPRPRPKDRQLMQDYIRELRGIVPDGVKCSIDSLLEKTIKHMLFLQSVTKYADELKGTAEPRLTTKEHSLPIQDKFEGGATWALDVGSKSMACPIIVEDLHSPRQMLVEMLCEERGFFLEIADLIRGLGLTILKGVMEARNAEVWARFTLEANRDVTRMEVFLSLVHLLDATVGNSNTSKQVSNLCSMSHRPNPSSLLDCLQ